jgi:hypothetical protein
MADKLYDLFSATAEDASAVFLMRAPLRIIATYLRLRIDAIRRITQETAENASRPCYLYSGSEAMGDRRTHCVFRATSPIGTEK